MEQVHRSSIEADNRLRTLETDQRRLELYHQMLNNISTQATLLLGFSLATYAVDLMPKVLDDAGTFCFYKTYASMVCGSLFMLCNTCTLGFCLLVILFSSLLILRSQTALLYVGGAAAVWRTHKLMHYIYMWYGLALANFITNAMLLMWIYLGFGCARLRAPHCRTHHRRRTHIHPRTACRTLTLAHPQRTRAAPWRFVG